jgi:type IV pilus assembly protein PilQ
MKTQALEKKQISGKIPSKAKLITNSYFEMDLQQVLSDLSIETGVPILWDNTVQGQVTFEAKGMTLNALLQALLTPLGFTFTIIDDIYFVGSVNPDEVSFGLLSKTEVVTLSNIDAEAAVKLLSDYFKPYIKGYKDANVVCITGPEEINDRIRADLLKLDKPPVQVLIEVMVTEISSDALREIGIDWTLNPAVTNPKWSVSMEHPELNESNISGTYNNPNLVIGEYTLELISSLEALIKKGQATIRANPRITTINGKKADISLTTDQYFIIQTGTSQFYQYNTLQSITSGIKVELTPYVSDSGEVTIYVKPEVGDVVGSGANGLPEISKRSANTSVRVKDGETFTIGGLSLQKNNSVKKKVPILADIPLLGYAFRYEKMELKDTEIIIFITPYILKLGKIG